MTLISCAVWVLFIVICVGNRDLWHLNGQRANPLVRGIAAVTILLVAGIAFFIGGHVMLWIGNFLLLPITSLF